MVGKCNWVWKQLGCHPPIWLINRIRLVNDQATTLSDKFFIRIGARFNLNIMAAVFVCPADRKVDNLKSLKIFEGCGGRQQRNGKAQSGKSVLDIWIATGFDQANPWRFQRAADDRQAVF